VIDGLAGSSSAMARRNALSALHLPRVASMRRTITFAKRELPFDMETMNMKVSRGNHSGLASEERISMSAGFRIMSM